MLLKADQTRPRARAHVFGMAGDSTCKIVRDGPSMGEDVAGRAPCAICLAGASDIDCEALWAKLAAPAFERRSVGGRARNDHLFVRGAVTALCRGADREGGGEGGKLPVCGRCQAVAARMG